MLFLAEAVGFEPTNADVKDPCVYLLHHAPSLGETTDRKNDFENPNRPFLPMEVNMLDV